VGKNLLPPCALKIQAAISFEVSINIYQSTRRRIPEDGFFFNFNFLRVQEPSGVDDLNPGARFEEAWQLTFKSLSVQEVAVCYSFNNK